MILLGKWIWMISLSWYFENMVGQDGRDLLINRTWYPACFKRKSHMMHIVIQHLEKMIAWKAERWLIWPHYSLSLSLLKLGILLHYACYEKHMYTMCTEIMEFFLVWGAWPFVIPFCMVKEKKKKVSALFEDDFQFVCIIMIMVCNKRRFPPPPSSSSSFVLFALFLRLFTLTYSNL